MVWLARAVLIVPAAVIVAASFWMNGTFWARLYEHDLNAARVFVGLSAVCGLFKVGVPVAMAILRIEWRAAPALAALWLCALTFDVFSGLAFSSMVRNDAAALRQHDAAPTVELARQRDDAAAALAKLADVRHTARIEVERKAAAAVARDCNTRRGADTDACKTVAKLDAELADARERDRLTAKVDELAGKLTGAEPVKDADPQLTAIALALAAVGLSADRDTAAKAFGLLLVLIIELGSTVAPREALRRVPAANADPLPEAPAVTASPDRAAPVTPAKPRQRAARSRIDPLDVVRSACAGRMTIPGATLTPDGWLYVSQRELAAVVGASPPTVGRALKAAETAGSLAMRVDSKGSAIKLLSVSNPAHALGA